VTAETLASEADPEGMILLENHEVDFALAFPDLLATDIYVEFRSFASGHRRYYESLSAPVSLMLTLADLSDSASARRAAMRPGQVVIGDNDKVPSVEPRRRSESGPPGSTAYTVLTAHGRFLVRLEAVAATGHRAGAEVVTERVLDQVLAAPTGVDSRRVPEPPGAAGIVKKAISQAWTWYLFASLLVIVRDRTFWQRGLAFVRRRQDPAQRLVDAGFQVVSIARRSTYMRWRAAASGMAWWFTRSFAAVFALFLPLIALALSPAVAVGGAALSVGCLSAWRAWRRRRRPDRWDQRRYRHLTAQLGLRKRVLVTVGIGASTTFLLVSVLAAGALKWFFETLPATEMAERLGSNVEIGVLFLVLMAWSFNLPWREAGRSARLGLDRVLDSDGRLPVLLLRSFEDDKLRLRTRRGGRHSLVERLSLRRFDRFEETIAWMLWRYGPVAAAAEPGRAPPPLGAARDFYRDEDWRIVIRALIGSSRLILVTVGPGAGLSEEIEELLTMQAECRAVFLIPPVPDADAGARLERLSEKLEIELPPVPQRMGSHVVLAVILDADRRPVFLTGHFRDDVSYEVTLSEAAKRVYAGLTESPADRLPLPAPDAAPIPNRRRRLIRACALPLPALALGLLAWLFFADAILKLRAETANSRDRLPPLHLPGLNSTPPAMGVAAAGGRTLTFDLSGDVQILDRGQRGDYRKRLPATPTAGTIEGDLAAFADLGRSELSIWDLQEAEGSRVVRVSSPIAIAAAGQTVVSVSARDGRLDIIDPDDVSPRSIVIGSRPVGVAVSEGFAAVADAGTNQVAIVELTTGSVMQRFNVCNGPRDLVLQPDGVVVVCELSAEVRSYSLSGVQRSSMHAGVSPFSIEQTKVGLVVLDRGRPGLLIVGPNGGISRHPAGRRPTGLAADGDYVLIGLPHAGIVGIYDVTDLPSR
jgi:hypothetical protein